MFKPWRKPKKKAAVRSPRSKIRIEFRPAPDHHKRLCFKSGYWETENGTVSWKNFQIWEVRGGYKDIRLPGVFTVTFHSQGLLEWDEVSKTALTGLCRVKRWDTEKFFEQAIKALNRAEQEYRAQSVQK